MPIREMEDARKGLHLFLFLSDSGDDKGKRSGTGGEIIKRPCVDRELYVVKKSNVY